MLDDTEEIEICQNWLHYALAGGTHLTPFFFSDVKYRHTVIVDWLLHR